jgi:hypothetical protein
VVLVNCQIFNVEWIHGKTIKNIFILNDNEKGMVSATELEIRPIVISWLECVDKYNLVQFMSNDAIDNLVELLKRAATRSKEEDIADFSNEFKRLCL